MPGTFAHSVQPTFIKSSFKVTGASDKTLRQWDLTTGQCVMTMDILWAISHPHKSNPGTALPSNIFSGATAAVGTFAVPTLPYADGSWNMYEDFVGGVQFWGYGLVSGSGDGAVRMWDSECRSFSVTLSCSLALKCALARLTELCWVTPHL
jgi:mitochondrial division protein 1